MLPSLPLVTVVIPAYNSMAHIDEAIASAQAQTYPNLEIIVIDDGSTDATPERISNHENVTLLRQANQGSAAARNLGISHARGDYIAFLDSDDVWWSGKIAAQMGALQQAGMALAYSRFILWSPDPAGHYPLAEEQFRRADSPSVSGSTIYTSWTYADLLLDCIVWTSTVLVRKDLLEKSGGFNPDLRKGQDYDLWLRLSRMCPMLRIEQPTALYRNHGQSITRCISDRCYGFEILSGAAERWGLTGPDGRSAPAMEFNGRLLRLAYEHAMYHLRFGNPQIAHTYFRHVENIGGKSFKVAVLGGLAKLRSLIRNTETKGL